MYFGFVGSTNLSRWKQSKRLNWVGREVGSICCPDILGCVLFHWSLANEPAATLLEKTASPLLAANS